MTDNFPAFAALVHEQFVQMQQLELFNMNVNGDNLFHMYLEAFPEETNPLYKERTEHDCQCCKNFIRNIGNVVGIDGGKLVTVWDTACEEAPYPYNEVATVIRSVVLDSNIRALFRTKERSYGNIETLTPEPPYKWNHFFTGTIPTPFRTSVADRKKGEYQTTVQVFERGLRELSLSAIETVEDLLGSIYRGEEHRQAVASFKVLHQEYHALDPIEQHTYLWDKARMSHARFRNTVIGTLVQDISDGVDLERAVKSFEDKVAPHNYKRTKAIVTPGMVKQAMKTINELGLEPALERRFAKLSDISVNDVLWVDNSVQGKMKDGIEGLLMQSVTPKQVDFSKAEDIDIEEFMARVLPEAQALEVLVKNDHLPHFMSLTAPVHPEPQRLFKWENDFAWSYAGNLADSGIKERVKAAGGKVDGELRFSLSWFDKDDLDLHVIGPGGHIHFAAKRGRCGGRLDVDMNAPDTQLRTDAVENIYWERMPMDGTYLVYVENYCHRDGSSPGFEVEMEERGQVRVFSCPASPREGRKTDVCAFVVRDRRIVEFTVGKDVTSSAASKEKWGVQTESFAKVNAVTLSPNYWEGKQEGNKHTFFILDGCENDEPTRGIYNEQLHPRLMEHRKVFDLIGEKTKCQPTEGQLSGLGFSSTKPATLTVKVDGGKLYNVHVNGGTQ